MLYRKITEGYVVQVFNDAGDCIAQRFTAGDVEYQTGEGDPINVMDMPKAGNEYHPFDLVQPSFVSKPNSYDNAELTEALK